MLTLAFGLHAHSYGDFKQVIVLGTGLSRDALHIHIGLLAFCTIRILWRSRRGSIAALTLVCLAALGGEWLDHISEMAVGRPCDVSDHLLDFVNSCLWPALLALAIEYLAPRSAGPDQSD